MKPFALWAVLAMGLSIATVAAGDSPPVPTNIAQAVADPGRPKADTDRDSLRHPAETLAFTGVKPGAVVLELMPGGGYFTRILSKAVGPSGHVYALVPEEIVKAYPQSLDEAKALAADPAYPNVTVLVQPINALSAPQPVDLVWISQNYHDLHDPFMGPADLGKVNAAALAALKPGGVYLVLDHVAQAGSGLRDTDTLHRIDPEVVKAEVTAAGFVLDAESELLRNPGDDHLDKVFDPAIRGRTDQFIFRFRKPAS